MVERVEGRRSGDPTIVGTRIPPEVVLNNFELGETPEAIARDYPTLSIETIGALIAYAQAQQLRAA